MTLEEYCATLPVKKQVELAIKFLNTALPIWESFVATNDLTYRDSVMLMEHTIDKNLPVIAIREAEKYFLSAEPGIPEALKKIQFEFTEPVVALQDGDWDIPEAAKKFFYSVHNLIDALMGQTTTAFKESTIYVCINQAIDAIQLAGLLQDAQIREILYAG